MNSLRRYRPTLGACLLALLFGASCLSLAQERQARGAGQGVMRQRSHGVGPLSHEFMLQYRERAGDSSDAGRIMDILDSFDDERALRQHLSSKLEEGLAKKVPLNIIAEVLERRREMASKAVDIVAVANVRSRGENGMTVLVAMALESGVDADVLDDLLRRTKDMSRGVVMAIVSATEIIRLNDINADLGMAFIEDCIQSQVNRPRILAGVNLLEKPDWQGRSYESIRDELWLQINQLQPHGGRSGSGQMMRDRRGREN